MKKLLLFLIPLSIYADNLKSIISFATQNSDLVVSKELTQKAKSSKVQSRESDYYPTIDVGSYYQSLDEKTPMMAGDVYSGYAKIGFDIYDGGKKSALLSQSKNEHKASGFDSASTKKTLGLEIVKDFFNIKSLQARLQAREEAKKSLQEQLTRMERFVIARVATKDDVDRLQAAYDTNIYEMESIELQLLSLKKLLELKVGKTIKSFDNSKFKEFNAQQKELTDSIKSLMAQKDALVSGANSVDSAYYPNLKIEDTYSVYGYERTDLGNPEGPNDQNKLMISLQIRLFDKGTIEKNKQAIMIQSQALDTLVSYSKKEQQTKYDIAIATIETNYIKIKSAKSALNSAKSAFEIISKKYDAGIVDNITYLDALSAHTLAKALYETSLNDLEIAYGAYYYYAGKNIEEFLQ